MGESLLLPMFASAAKPPVHVQTDDGLRDYQRDAVRSIHEAFTKHRSTLLVMATGLGKTITFASIAKHWPGRVLVLAHRDELIQQAQKKLRQLTGEHVEIEQASFTSSDGRLVVGSVQTLCRPQRLARLASDRFGLVVVDEAHHSPAKSYKAILGHFSGARLLGVTATPDRGDGRGLKQVFESVAYKRDINDGIADGYLAPVRTAPIVVDAIDLSAVGTVAGDLNQGQLDAVMSAERALHGVVTPTMEQSGDRQTIVFTTSVENAHLLAEIFNRNRPGSARAVDGKTDIDERRRILAGHKRRDFQYLINVGVLTEGYDDPTVSCIAMARPTKSRALYTQCIGRGLRILDGIGEIANTDERVAAVAASAKPDCLVLDFVGNSGKHELISPLDILGGSVSDEVRRAARKLAVKRPGMLAGEALAEAKRQVEEARRKAEAAKRASITAKVDYRVVTRDAFSVLHMKDPGAQLGGEVASMKQLDYLQQKGVDIPANCTKAQASAITQSLFARQRQGLATYKQMRTLQRYGVDAVRMSMGTASRILDSIAQNGWRLPERSRVDSIIGASREVGAEG